MDQKIIMTEIDLRNLPPLSQRQSAELKVLRGKADATPDTSDIAPLSETFWKTAVRNPFLKPGDD